MKTLTARRRELLRLVKDCPEQRRFYAIAITDEDGDTCYYKRYADGSELFVAAYQFPNRYKTEAAAKRQMNRIRRYLVPEYLETLRIATHPGWHYEQLRRAR